MKTCLPSLLSVILLAISLLPGTDAFAENPSGLSPEVQAQIAAIMEAKRARTPVQMKVDSKLLVHARQAHGLVWGPGTGMLPTDDLTTDAQGRVQVDITATVSPALLSAITDGGGAVVNSVAQLKAIRAYLSPDQFEVLAQSAEVTSIVPAVGFITNTGAATSQGDFTHRAAAARTTYGTTGAGIKVGVLSDGVDNLAASKASGDIKNNASVLTSQAGSGTKGTAMMEIIQDIAPDAELVFATGTSGAATFAANIIALKNAGCSIIVDDVTVNNESPFQDGVIAQAVKTVSDAGVLYFSCARDAGNKNDGTSSTWEGDYANGPAVSGPIATAGETGNFHDFGGGTVYNIVAAGGSNGRVDLFWSDPLGASGNDYDVFVLDSAGTTLKAFSAAVQNGTQDPYEAITSAFVVPGAKIAIVKFSGVARFLHLEAGRQRLTVSTGGAVRGHNASGAANAFCVAATDITGLSPSPFTTASVVESFSADGPRRMFFGPTGTPFTPGNVTSTGGIVLQKPDITAADGIVTSFTSASVANPYFGTSVAAPHAAGLAALIKAYKPTLTPAEIRNVMLSTALDIEESGVDRDSGYGVAMADRMLQAVDGVHVMFDSSKVSLGGGNGNGAIDPNENNELTVTLRGGMRAAGPFTQVSGTLSTTTPGVKVLQSKSNFVDIPSLGYGTGVTPFLIETLPAFVAGTPIAFTLKVAYTGGSETLNFTQASGVLPNGSISTAAGNGASKTLIVTSTNDDGPGSLRQAVRDAATRGGTDFITFQSALNGKTIALGSEIVVNDLGTVTIDASSLSSGLTIDGGPGTNRIFSVSSGTRLALNRLTLVGGNGDGASNSGNGGAVSNSGQLTLTNCTVANNSTTGYGGGLYNSGTMTLVGCSLVSNSSGAGSTGGAIDNSGGTLAATNCTFSANQVIGGSSAAGAIWSNTTAVIRHCTFALNSASNTSCSGALFASGATIAVSDSLIVSNTVPGGASPEVKGTFVSGGGNVIGIVDGSTGFVGLDRVGTAGSPLIAPIGPLADNGGPTKTLALLPGNPAIDAAVNFPATGDQRGLPVSDGVPDSGAFEIQTGGVFAFSVAGFSGNEGGSAAVSIARSGGIAGSASVTLSTSPGTALISDFTPATQVVTFGDGEIVKLVNIALTMDALPEKNESFTATLSSPSAGTSLGSPATATVTIVDGSAASDTTYPTAPVITSPAANASIGVNVGGFLTLTGTASDNQGVHFVHVYDGSDMLLGNATLEAPGAPTTKWTINVLPVAGTNTFRVRTEDYAPMFNPANTLIPVATRTVKVLRPLIVNVSGVGSVSPTGFVPTSYREVGRPYTLTATAGAGSLFAGWSILGGHTLSQLGITSTAALDLPALTFIHKEGLALQAKFVATPYLASNTGTFNGGITPSLTQPPGGTAWKLDTEGYITLTVQPSSGSFSGVLWLDGAKPVVVGAFDNNGDARFGKYRSKTFTVTRADKPGLNVALHLSILTGKLTGTVAQFDGMALVALSDVDADRAVYSKTNIVPPNVFGASPSRPVTGAYTLYFTPPNGGVLPADQFPHGYGIGTLSLSTAGAVTMSATLADGTKATQSTTITPLGTWRLFTPIYSNQGFIAGNVQLNHSMGTYDFLANGARWLRPIMNSLSYPLGWQQGITADVIGSRYIVTPGTSVLTGLNVTHTGTLSFTDGGLTSFVSKLVNISPADAVTNLSLPINQYSLTINRTTGLLTGSFTHTNTTKPAFNGVTFQKFPHGYGFFMTADPAISGGPGGAMVFTP